MDSTGDAFSLASLESTNVDIFQNGGNVPNFKASTPRSCRKKFEMNVRRSPSPGQQPPPIPKTPKPQTAVTKPRTEDFEIGLSEKSLRKISSARELMECWLREINSPASSRSPCSQLKRRHTDVLRRKCNSSQCGILLSDPVTDDGSSMTSGSTCPQSHSSICKPNSPRLGFDRNCPSRRAKRRRSRDLTMQSLNFEISKTTPESRNSEINTLHSSNRPLQKSKIEPSFKGLKLRSKLSILSFA